MTLVMPHNVAADLAHLDSMILSLVSLRTVLTSQVVYHLELSHTQMPAPPPPAKFGVFVVAPGVSSYVADVDADTTVWQLCTRVADELLIPADAQRVFFNNQELIAAQTLGEAGVVPETTFFVVRVNV
jgi:hypothetical protein